MQFDHVLIFDIKSEYGHFRKFNTTTSPLTYTIPTRPAIAGLLGAMLGVERESAGGKYPEGSLSVTELFSKDNTGIAIQIVNPVKKVNIAFNLLDTEKAATSFFNIKQRTQIEFELLKMPHFRIFVGVKDEKLFIDLCNRIKENKLHFTPYLGLSQFTAIVEYKDIAKVAKLESDTFTEVLTAVNLNNVSPDNAVDFNYAKNFKYTSDTMPVAMQKDRTVTEYAEIIMETNGHPIAIKSKHILQLQDWGNILFL
ncbi:type I-B CRISPR-associated protein Cas5 [Chitinophaga oryziterrae]|uniref:Type I-B CRISPR-associated protein Cas5 n=1 Tax=Chitinophaga oryziterrae TaxID=1031224 RepID=A0A6N8JL98_9BACT|nr:type I-B CRISPR-associated protein Cas5b [Chitinophaga oryziterrae]MVT45189.1 type I-B CRISPR-associated protein Cas5 [Chitinophaga oryziterrae]